MTASSEGIEQALDKHEGEIMALDGISGVGIGSRDAKPVILIMVKERTAELERALPKELDGYPVVLEEVGEIKAL